MPAQCNHLLVTKSWGRWYHHLLSCGGTCGCGSNTPRSVWRAGPGAGAEARDGVLTTSSISNTMFLLSVTNSSSCNKRYADRPGSFKTLHFVFITILALSSLRRAPSTVCISSLCCVMSRRCHLSCPSMFSCFVACQQYHCVSVCVYCLVPLTGQVAVSVPVLVPVRCRAVGGSDAQRISTTAR
jgi:hypothetical protein